ncbi:MAG TPA: DUF4365 domain-containing protein [Pyrinomonadaceae bacterium]|jgi:hypothetical protein
MKYPKTKIVGKSGVIYVDCIVNAQGSVFRPVHQEDDFGIDGYIELVNSEYASGRLIAVQIKTGASYLSKDKQQFEVKVDNHHLNYWRNFVVPVILICHSPSINLAAWVSIRDYIEQEEYHDRTPIKKITVPLSRLFNGEAISKGITALAHARADERLLIKCADMCLSTDAATKRQGFQILTQHPDSRRLKITCLLARSFLMDDDTDAAKDALFTLGFGVGRKRWSFNPENKEEAEVILYAGQICSDLSTEEIRRLVELVDDEYFNGPDGLGERCFDILCCCFEKATDVLEEMACNKSLPMQRRINALYLLYECDREAIEEAFLQLCKNPNLVDVLAHMFHQEIVEAVEGDDRVHTL